MEKRRKLDNPLTPHPKRRGEEVGSREGGEGGGGRGDGRTRLVA